MSRRPGIGFDYVDKFRKWHHVNGLKNYVANGKFRGKLARYYKEKLFSQLERERLNYEAIEIEQENYLKEIEALSAFHPDPHAYHYERLKHMHEAIEKSSFKNKHLF